MSEMDEDGPRPAYNSRIPKRRADSGSSQVRQSGSVIGMNMKNLKIHDAAGWTMFIFGVLAWLLGLLGLIRPELILSVMGFNVLERAGRVTGDYTLVFVTASSMASFNMGVYYVLAALNNVKAFYAWTVPFRAVTFTVFTLTVATGLAPIAWLGVAVWELTGGIATGLALYIERRRGQQLK